MKKTIGLYDSGVGGLSVLKEMIKSFPNEKFIYFADTAHLPYGNKSKKEILQYSRNISKWMEKEMRVDLIIAACNTSSALALDEISSEISTPIIGTITPILNYIHTDARIKKLGIIATQASINSGAYKKMIKSSGFSGKIISLACPEFVDIIENGIINSHDAINIIQNRLLPFHNKIDSLIFGCTHYIFIQDIIKNILGENIVYIDPAQYIASELKGFIKAKPTEKSLDISFYTSGNPEAFSIRLMNLLGINAMPHFISDTELQSSR